MTSNKISYVFKIPEAPYIFQEELNKKKVGATGGIEDIIKKGPIDRRRDAARKAEVQSVKEHQLAPTEVRMTQFRDLLAKKEVSTLSTWEKERHKIVLDSRCLLLTLNEEKQVFDTYVHDRAEEERREKNNR